LRRRSSAAITALLILAVLLFHAALRV
jgi:hypothetical protein